MKEYNRRIYFNGRGYCGNWSGSKSCYGVMFRMSDLTPFKRKGQVMRFGWGIALQTAGKLQTDDRLRATRFEFSSPTDARNALRA